MIGRIEICKRNLDSDRGRYVELDWLRIIVVINLIPFHVAWLMTMVPGFSHINHSHFLTKPLIGYVLFCSPLHMFLLFLIAGISTAVALRTRSIKEYVKERLKRLLIPLLFFMVTLFPILGYFWPGSAADKSFSHYFFHFWPYMMRHFFNGGGPRGGPIWGHMWFVGYLLIMSFLLLPFLLYLQKEKGRRLLETWASFFSIGYRVFLPGILVVLVFAVLAPVWSFFQNNLHTDWGYFTYNMMAFFLGFVICSNGRLWQAIDKYCKLSLLFGMVLSILKIIMDAYIPAFSKPAYSIQYMMYSIIAGFNTWFWAMTFLGIARKRLNFSNRFSLYFNKISYPFYIWHLTVMVVIGFYVCQWQMGIDFEFIILTVFSFGASLLCSELVRKFKITRFLFGIK